MKKTNHLNLLYQNIKNGNLKKMVAKMKNTEMKAIDKMEDMMQ